MTGAFSIGEWRVDPSLRTLSGAKGDVHLEPKHMQVLTVLAEHAGQVVSKERLLQTVWADTFVGDEALSKAISELRRSLGDDPKTPRFIQTIPKGGYRLVAAVAFGPSASDELVPASASELTPAAPAPLRPPWFRRPTLAAALGLVLLAALATSLVRFGVGFLSGGPGERLVGSSGSVTQLTTQSGLEFDPAFSPDGTQLVYSHMAAGCSAENCGPDSEHSELWQTVVGSNDVRQLTTGPGLDVNARFSPDGRQVAFVRSAPGRRRLMLVSAVGGPATKLSEFPAADAAIAWSGDGTVIIAGRDPVDDPHGDRGLYAVPLSGGAPRAITHATPPMMHVDPALSPDGHRLAFVACRSTVLHPFDCDVAVADITSDLRTTSPVRRLVTMPMLSGPVWDSDGKSVIFAGDPDGSQIRYLWKLAADGRGAPERLDSAGRDIGDHLAMARESRRLAFSRFDPDDRDIIRVRRGEPPATLISSSMGDAQGTYSEDGRRIAFVSNRSGANAVWVSDADGAAPRQLTHGPNGHEASPKWSPNGKRIAFDSESPDGHWHVRVIDGEGGPATQLTFGPEDQNLPFWSRDGQWVYFASGHGQGIARVPARGGAPERIVTGESGLIASESTDGRSIVFQPNKADSPLLERGLAGGPVREVLPCVQAGAFAVQAIGIYYIPCGAGRDPVVHLLGPSDHQDRPVFALKAYEGHAYWSLSVSPDGSAMLYVTAVSERGDLWMLENFR